MGRRVDETLSLPRRGSTWAPRDPKRSRGRSSARFSRCAAAEAPASSRTGPATSTTARTRPRKRRPPRRRDEPRRDGAPGCERGRVISGVVLAAGSSTRMGKPKLTLPLGDRRILSHVLDAAIAAPLDEVVVVLGPDAEDVRAALGDVPAAVRFVTNPDHLRGQSTSLRAGLGACDPSSVAAVILLGDQPGVAPGAIESVVEAFSAGGGDPGHDVVQASYGGRPAHPTVLARAVWGDVVRDGDEGARAWISEHPDRLTLVEVGGRPPVDVDTPEEYEQLLRTFGAS